MQFFDLTGQELSDASTVFANKTIVLSIPSTGNVGQLAADALITTMNSKRVGFFDAGSLVLAMAGNDAYLKEKNSSGELHTCVEGIVHINYHIIKIHTIQLMN